MTITVLAVIICPSGWGLPTFSLALLVKTQMMFSKNSPVGSWLSQKENSLTPITRKDIRGDWNQDFEYR